MAPAEQYLQKALDAFDFGGQVVGAVRFGSGHINDTFCVHTQPGEDPCRRFILQRISPSAFHHPEQVMANIAGVTSHLKKEIAAQGGDPERETLSLCQARDGRCFYTDPEGGAWRVYPFLEGTMCLQSADTPERFAASARAFGKFQRMLKDYPADTLYETIPHFHDTEARLAKLKEVVAADPMGRVKDVGPELAFVAAREGDCSVVLQALRSGELPLRVTHNDTKLNNVLLDRTTGEAVCVIDLDTVMPGLSINDFGDSIRFGANHCAEDETDLDKVNFDLNLFDAYTRGFLEGAEGAFTPAELDYLPWGARLITLECGIRFLTDYLEGDKYFRIHRPGQNLDRCRTQFKLVADMEACWDKMCSAVDKYR